MVEQSCGAHQWPQIGLLPRCADLHQRRHEFCGTHRHGTYRQSHRHPKLLLSAHDTRHAWHYGVHLVQSFGPWHDEGHAAAALIWDNLSYMPQSLLLPLPPAGQEETEWLTLDETGAPTPTRQRGSLSLAAAVWRTGRVVVLAPATQILLAEPELPPGSGAKLARAVPFALEEQLTEDVDQMSFAVGRRSARGGTAVAAVSRTVLADWISALTAAGLEPVAMYPY